MLVEVFVFFRSPLVVGLLWVLMAIEKINLIVDITVVLIHGLSVAQLLCLMSFGFVWMIFNNSTIYGDSMLSGDWCVCVFFHVYIFMI